MASWLTKVLGFAIAVCAIIGQSSCDNHTYYYRVSAVIVNRNFSKDIMDPESPARANMTREILQGLTKIYNIPLKKYNSKNGELKNVTIKDIHYGPPSFQEVTNTSLIKKEARRFEKPEIGVYFLALIYLEFNITNLHGIQSDVHYIKESILDSLLHQYFMAFRTDVLGHTLRINTSFLWSEELPSKVARRMEDILKYKNNYVSTIVHQTLISDKDRDILSTISYVGCAFSLLGLTISVLTIIGSRKLRRLRANQILLQMCLSLLGALLFYSFGIRQLKDESMVETCKAISALLHYFILASMIWASIEAYNLYQDLVKVFDTSTLSHNEFMFRASLAGWVPPGIIVGATVLVSNSSYGFHVPDKEHTLCWLKLEAFYGALLSPVLLLVIGNMIIFVIVMREIFKMPQAHEKHSKLSQFRATISVFTLLGLNWVFAGMAAATPILVFQYLFTITCSFQGFLIFILHGLLKKDFRDAWRNLTAKNKVMEMLRSSHSQSQKTNSSSVSHNSTGPTNSHSFSTQNQAKFDRMSEMDSGIEEQKANV